MWHYVYVFENSDGRQYVGATENIEKRIQKHNKGDVPSTSGFVPWKLRYASAFPNKEKALDFEKYLKQALEPCSDIDT